MRKTLIALSAIAVVALVQASPVTNTKEITVNYDEQAAKNVSFSIFHVF